MSQNKYLDLILPKGRLVMGSPSVKNTTGHNGQPIPEDKQEFFVGVAIPKTDQSFNGIMGQLFTLAQTEYAQAPAILQQIGQGLAAPSFSWKIEDGDVAKPDPQTGQLKPIPDYMQGCWIVKTGTKHPIKACNIQGVDMEPSFIKKGDYVQLGVSAGINGQYDHTAGIKLYVNQILLVEAGDAIGGGQSASSVFAAQIAQANGGQVPQQPAGGGMPMGNAPVGAVQGTPQHTMVNAATAAPVQNAAPMQQQSVDPNVAPAPAQTGHAGMPGMAGDPQAAMAGTASPTTQPHTDILNGPSGMPAAGGAPAGAMPGMPGA